MSDQDGENSPMRTEASHRNATHNESMEDTLAANNSLMGKVKSRVSSILPNSLSKWFSPSTKNSNNDSLNGSINNNANSNLSRRRRRIEVEEEEEEEYVDDEAEDEEEDAEDDDVEHDSGEFDENLFTLERDRNDDEDDDEDDDVGDDNSEESNNSDLAVTTTVTREGNFKHTRHSDHMRTSTVVRQPPSKRSRLNMDNTFSSKSNHNTPLSQRQPLLSSTPGIAGGNSLSIQYSPASRSTTNRYTHLNLYGNQAKKEPAYNFNASPVINAMTSSKISPRFDPDIIDLVPEQAVDSNMRSGGADLVSSRRSLNIPPTTTPYTTSERGSAALSNLKRQSLSSVKNELTSNNLSSLPRRTSTTIFESDTCVGNMSLHSTNQQQQQQQQQPQNIQPQRQQHQHHNLQSNVIVEVQEDDFTDNNNAAVVEDDTDEIQQSKKFNGEAPTFKRQKLTNGAGVVPLKSNKNSPLLTTNVHLRDSASESSDGGGGKAETSGTNALPRKSTGLFNISAANSRNGSRTSSFGNGLNFYTHLEGRKSLFSGGGSGPQAGTSACGTPLNNSTLSLTSLNRRQFNASIYGSTSALSDSRLLNTFSPFYKGKTTYGGAAAYNKYSMSSASTGAGASVVRITPTLIRPTSSLSTLSSSNNSTSAGGGGVQLSENPSAISSTAKRILDLINDFATPLSEAKKMASNLKSSHHDHHQQQAALNQSFSKTQRFNETDLMTTRAMRLSQVRTPYSRSTVTLIPNAAASSNASLPPVRELQVPSMSQLLQMKKMQQTTERSRQIATEKNSSCIGSGIGAAQGVASSTEYTLPSTDLNAATDSSRIQKQHTNKIKNKVTRSGRLGSKDCSMACNIDDEAPSAPVNLPNIAFPLMQSVPKFDINVLPSQNTSKNATTASAVNSAKDSKGSDPMNTSQTKMPLETLKQNFAKTGAVSALQSANTTKISSSIKEYKFSTPLPVQSAIAHTQHIEPISDNFKFSAPMFVEKNAHTQQQQQQLKQQQSPPQQQPQLKTGSVLDALKKPFTLPTTTATKATASASPTVATNDSLLAQFKKSPNEWECQTCMIRNKQDVSKCVACETPRKIVSSLATKAPEPNSTAMSSLSSSSSSTTTATTVFGNFGNQFKKSSSEWECDTCMIRNKQDVTRCVACETPRKQTTSASTSIKSSFGDAFKPKANTWECPTCLINNKAEVNECLACQTKKPGSTLNPLAQPALPPATIDAGFKSLAAAQKASKWECEACMTRNDASKLKCVCCEQAKPGSNAVSENVPKFNFGSTAAAKFSFGFGNQNAPKEEELRKAGEKEKQDTAKAAAKPTVGFTFDASSAKLATPAVTPSTGGFTFGIKPIVPAQSTTETKNAKDTVDTNKTPISIGSATTTTTTAAPTLSGFRFGSVDSSASNSSATTTISSATTSTIKAAGFVFGTTTTTKPAESSGNAAPTVKFTLPTTTTSASSPFDNLKSSSTTQSSVSTSIFGSSKTAEESSTFKPVQQPAATAGFSFGLSKPAADATKLSSITRTTTTSSSAVTETAPKSTGFSFKAPTSVASAAATPTASNTFTFGATPSAAVSSTESKIVFGSAISANTAAPSASIAPTTLTKPATGGFSFGSSISAGSLSSATSTTKPSLFGVTPTATTTTQSTMSTTAPPVTAQATNIFGSFGGGGGATITGNNLFGSSNAANSTPVFGSTALSATTAPFSFGTASNVATAATCTATTTTVSSSTTWPKNSFVFGSSTATTTTPASSTLNDAIKPPAFGSGATFGTSLSQPATNTAASSIFGSNPQASATSNFSAPATFGSVVANTPIFGASSTPATASTGLGSSSNLFGSSSVGVTNIGSASATTPAFGSSPFGGSSNNAASAVVVPTFGAAASNTSVSLGAAPTNTFGGFGATAAAATSNATDGASAAKKSEPAFNFGATPVAPQASSGGFNFGAVAVAKPAFNFGASTGTTASFNFTGTNTEMPKSSQPFQFGATSTPVAPVFNFGGVATEQTSNAAPFQFNAGSTQPVMNNIFAPTPTPPGAQAAQQARRKIRPPMRRLTPR